MPIKTSTKLLIGLAVVAGLALTFAPGPILKAATLRALKKASGFEVSYASMKSNPWRRTMDVEGLVFKNPPDFPETDAIEIRHLHAKYRWRDLLGDAVRLEELQLDIGRVVMVRLADGDTNLQRMQESVKTKGKPVAPTPPPVEKVEPAAAKLVPEPAAPEPAPPEPVHPKAAPKPELSIGSLELKIGTVEIHDYGRMKKGKPHTQVYELNAERAYQDVTDLEVVGQQLAAQVLVQEGLRAMNAQLQDPEAMDKLGKKLEKVLGNFLK